MKIANTDGNLQEKWVMVGVRDGPPQEFCLAVRLGKRIDWDMKNMEARGLPEVKAMLKRDDRAGREPKLT